MSEIFILFLSTCELSKKELWGVSGVLASEARRANKEVGFWGRRQLATSPSVTWLGSAVSFPSMVWVRTPTGQPFFVLPGIQAAYSAKLLRVTSTEVPQSVSKGNGRGQKLHEQGGVINCSTGSLMPQIPPSSRTLSTWRISCLSSICCVPKSHFLLSMSLVYANQFRRLLAEMLLQK